MKKLAILAAILSLGAVKAMAQSPTFEVAYSTFATMGVNCTSGTVVNIVASRPTAFAANVAGYRILNQDSTNNIWLGGISVTTHTTTDNGITNLGERLKPGESAVWPLYKDYKRLAAMVPIYCKAADAAATSGVKISVVWFGY